MILPNYYTFRHMILPDSHTFRHMISPDSYTFRHMILPKTYKQTCLEDSTLLRHRIGGASFTLVLH